MRSAAIVWCAAVAVGLVTGGCSLLAPAAPAVVPTFSTATTTPAPVVPVKAGLPTSCKDLLNGQQLDAVLGLPLSGVVRTVLGQPSPSVGLTGRVTCSYGIPSPSGGYALQLSAETYRDDAAAAARIPVNVDALRTPGVNPIPITIGPYDGDVSAPARWTILDRLHRHLRGVGNTRPHQLHPRPSARYCG